jgi:hypothetical protein
VLEPDHSSVSLRNRPRAGTAESCQMGKDADEFECDSKWLQEI